MKLRFLLLPACALVFMGMGFLYQRRAIASFEGRNEKLREAIRSVHEGGQDAAGGNPADTRPLRPEEAMLAGRIDWKEVAAKLKEADGDSAGNIRFMLALQKRLMAMSVEELNAAFDGIAAGGLTERERDMLETHLLSQLAKQQPRLVLERFGSSLKDLQPDKVWLLSTAFKQWAGEDPATAGEWLDRQVGAGSFESKELKGDSDRLRQFETGLVSSLLSIDPQAAARRVAALPGDERAAFLREIGSSGMKPGTEQAYADLVRQSVPEAQQASTLAWSAGVLAGSGEGFERVDQYLAGIGASAKERGEIAEQAVLGKLSSSEARANFAAELDSARNWAGKTAPDTVNEITGRAIGALAYRDPDQALKLAIQYQENGGGDDVMVAFLKAGGGRSREQAMKLLDRITDEARREEVRGTLDRNFGVKPR